MGTSSGGLQCCLNSFPYVRIRPGVNQAHANSARLLQGPPLCTINTETIMQLIEGGASQIEGVSERISTGVPGLDYVLNGGLIGNRFYLVEGVPGAGKTTLGLHFLLEGVRRGEPGLYITLSETAAELQTVAASHGWSLEGLAIHELVSEEGLGPDVDQSILHPSEVELGETVDEVRRKVLDL